jgi:hypothetical protein
MSNRDKNSKKSIDNALTFLIVGVLFVWGVGLIFNFLNN